MSQELKSEKTIREILGDETYDLMVRVAVRKNFREEFATLEKGNEHIRGRIIELLTEIKRGRVGTVGDHQIYTVQFGKKWIDELYDEILACANSAINDATGGLKE